MNESVHPSLPRGLKSSPSGVYVDLRELTALQFKASGFTFLPRQPIHSLLSGKHASRLRGRGLNFEELRRYQPGDDIRTMDWRVTARVRKPYVRVYTEERDRPCLLVVDQRVAMFFGSVRNMKSVAAAELAAIGAWRVLSQKDRVGAVVFNDSTVDEIRPHRSRSAVMQILGSLVKYNHSLSLDAGVQPKPAMLNEALRRTDRLATHDFLVCIITDGNGFDDESRRLLTRIARHNDVLFGFVYDPMEAELPDAGSLVMGDGSSQVEVDTARARLRERYRDSFDEHRRIGREFLLQREAPVLPICTDRDVADQLRTQLNSTRVPAKR